MDLGTTFAIFFIVATLLLSLFCILLKYYSHRLKKQRRKIVEIDHINCSFQNISSVVIQGAYQEFRERNRRKKMATLNGSQLVESPIETSEIKQMLDLSNNIYGLSSFRKRIDTDTIPLQSQLHRSMTSMKQFNISRLNTMQTQRERKFYNYVKKLIAYDHSMLKITEIHASNIKKIGSQCKITRRLEDYVVSEEDNDFLDMLDVHGFCYDDFGYYKYTHFIDITDMKNGETKAISGLENTISKELIEEEEYDLQRQEMMKQK